VIWDGVEEISEYETHDSKKIFYFSVPKKLLSKNVKSKRPKNEPYWSEC
jgi:hypothetical protein